MKNDLEGVELAMALEEAILDGDAQLSVLKPYLLRAPAEVLCIRGGFETEVVVYAKHRNTAFFVALDSAQFGVGETNEYGDVVDAYHYPNITMALRAFMGAASRQNEAEN